MGKFALLIGVGKYQSPELQDLAAAIPDVQAIEKVLLDPAIADFAEADVRVLPNPDPQQMREAIERLFTDRKKDDLVLLYFSGHGVVDDFGKFHLTSAQTEKRFLNSTAIPATFVHGLMEASKSQRQVVILDSCFSGAFAKEMKAKGEAVNLQPQLGGKGRAVLTSSSATEYSFEQKEGELSVYTQYLEEGLRTGIADRDEDGWISIDELHEFARGKVRDVAPAMQPKIYAVEEGYKIVFAKAPVDDPKLAYRKEVEKLAKDRNGFISPILKRGLTQKFNRHLSADEMSEILTEVLKPHREFEEKLEQFSLAIEEFLALPSHEQLVEDLVYFQNSLGFRDEDVAHLVKDIVIIPQPLPVKSLEIAKEKPKQNFKSKRSADDYVAQGNIKYNCQDYIGAIEEYNKSLEINPDEVNAYINRGNTRNNLSDDIGAIEDYSKAIELKPDDAEVYSNRGLSRCSISDYKGAIEDFNKAIELKPDFGPEYYNRGFSRCNIRDYKGAIEDYSKAIELKPDFAEAYISRGNTRLLYSDDKGAIRDYSKAIELKPNSTSAYYNRGLSRSNLSDNNGAISDYSRAIELNPGFAAAYNNRGLARCEIRDYLGAIEDFNKAIALKSDFSEAYNNRGILRSNLSDNIGAIEDYSKAIAVKPDYADAYYNRAISHKKIGDMKSSIAGYQKAINLYPSNNSSRQQALYEIKEKLQ